MPSGRTHDRLTLATAAVSLPVWLVASANHDPVPYVYGVSAYLFSGFWLSGDLDTNSVCYKRWGFFKFIWWPYRKMVPHRSIVSHGLVVGPLLRVVYFAIVTGLLLHFGADFVNKYFLVVDRTGILRHTRLSTLGWLLLHPSAAISAVIGLVLGGFTHTIADAIFSFWKRIW
jgi:uncharacterized metal-binding protein